MAIIIYPDLSYKIIGILFDVYNELGSGYQEKYYQKALSIRFEKGKFKFKEQLKIDLSFDGRKIGNYFIDFLIENKIVLEIKVANRFYSRHINQVKAYLTSKGLKLGILSLFTNNGIRYKRILNSKSEV